MIDPIDEIDEPAADNSPAIVSTEETTSPLATGPAAVTPLPPKPRLGEILLPFLITGGVLLLDQFSKNLVETRIPLYGYWAPIPSLAHIFRITHTANTGAVFGLFQGSGWFFAILAIVVAAAIVYFNVTLPGGQWLLRVALGLQLGGALGNLTDRLRQGHVTDFIDVGPWYIFNVADMALIGGVFLFGIVLLRDERRLRAGDTSALRPAEPQE
jgi:signal peptidase II